MTLVVGAVAFVLGWIAGRLVTQRDRDTAWLIGYEKGQEQATRFFADAADDPTKVRKP